MKIGFIDYKHPSGSYYGQSRQFITFQIEMQPKESIDFKVISPKPFGLASLDFLLSKKNLGHTSASGGKISQPSFLKFPTNYLTPFLFNFQLRSLSKSLVSEVKRNRNLQDIDLIHSHFGMFGASSIKLKKYLGVPLITTFYGHDVTKLSKLVPNIYKDLSKEGDLNLALSLDMKKDLLNLGLNNVKVWRLGVDTNFFIPAYNRKNEKIRIITVARFSEKKGIKYGIKAFKELLQFNQNIEYTIVGYGSLKRDYEILIRRLGIEDKVTLVNNLEKKNPVVFVRDMLQKSDIFLLPSIVGKDGDKEGTPVVLMEAQACGLPCVSTNHAGIPEVVRNGTTGFTVEERNSSLLCESLIELIDNKDLYNSFSKQARNHIISNYNCIKQAKLLAKYYGDLLT